MNFILGNGLIGLLAGKALNRKIIPYGKSRFYSYSVPLAENIIRYVKDDVIEFLGHLSPLMYVQKMSLDGKLFDVTNELRNVYMNKLGTPNSAVGNFLGSSMTLKTTCTDLYESLRREINVHDVKIRELRPFKMILDNGTIVDYESLISTIPLYVLLKLFNMDINCEARDVYYCHVGSNDIDLEGASCVHVLDQHIEFHKVTTIRKSEYVFDSFIELDEWILGKYLRNFKIIQKTVIRKSMPIDMPPNLDILEKMGVICVGSCAQWDEAMDVSSCIRRILKKGNSG
jgi:hypothetical protein